MNGAGGVETSQLCSVVPAQRVEVPKGGTHHGVSQGHGLMGIHDPDALQCYADYTFCPWCGKEGQNEGTMVNHLRMTHYRLGLVCNQCLAAQW